eukprot:SAG22_NODE_13928_length_390_cov_1.247423_1_plen_22_part_10
MLEYYMKSTVLFHTVGGQPIGR